MFKDIVFLQFSILQDKKALCQKATHSVDWGDLSSAILEQAGRFCTYRMGAPTLTPKFTRGSKIIYRDHIYLYKTVLRYILFKPRTTLRGILFFTVCLRITLDSQTNPFF